MPNFVRVSTVAHLPAYTKLVKNHPEKIYDTIPTRAIYETMKIGNAVRSTYGGFYDNGGWGV